MQPPQQWQHELKVPGSEQAGQGTDAVVADGVGAQVDKLQLEGVADQPSREQLEAGIVHTGLAQIEGQELITVARGEQVGEQEAARHIPGHERGTLFRR